MLCLFLSVSAWAAPWLIQEGSGYGPVRLGQTQAKAEESLGAPTSSEPGSSDPESRFNTYAKDTALLLNRERKVLGITITGGSARTASGLGIGSSWAEVRSALGSGLKRGAGNRTYPNRGIGFTFTGQNVSKVFVFKKEDVLPLQGDRLIVPGVRAGDLKLGMTQSVVESFWGKPSSSEGENLRWSRMGVGLMIRDGRVAAITMTTGDYLTSGGLKVGVPGGDVITALGKPGVQNKAGLFYPRLGLAFYLTQNQVSTIQVFPPER